MSVKGLHSTLSALTFRGLRANADVYRFLSLPVISTGRSFAYYRRIFFGNDSRREVLEGLNGKRVVDVGCGLTPHVSDSMFQACREQGIEFFGVDPKFSKGFSLNSLDVAKIRAVGGRGKIYRRAPGRERCIAASADRLPFDDGSIDLILSNFLLYAWITEEELLGMIYREFYRVLSDAGEIRIYPAPELDVDEISNAGLRSVMKKFDVRQQFFMNWLSPGQYPPAFSMSMKKK
jgi:ubiquinone/menaquinone biosynthesis C-methylase UbiE